MKAGPGIGRVICMFAFLPKVILPCVAPSPMANAPLIVAALMASSGVSAMKRHGDLLFRVGEFRAASRYYEGYLRAWPEDDSVIKYLALSYKYEGRYPEALEVISTMYRDDAARSLEYYGMGETYLQLSQPFDAHDAFLACVQMAARLKAAGTVTIGKLNCDEFAMGGANENSAYQVARNPWDTHRIPGGSSGGSAVAVAARLVPGATGATSSSGGARRPEPAPGKPDRPGNKPDGAAVRNRPGPDRSRRWIGSADPNRGADDGDRGNNPGPTNS